MGPNKSTRWGLIFTTLGALAVVCACGGNVSDPCGGDAQALDSASDGATSDSGAAGDGDAASDAACAWSCAGAAELYNSCTGETLKCQPDAGPASCVVGALCIACGPYVVCVP